MPVYVHVIDHPLRAGWALVDTGMTQLHPAVADMDPRLNPQRGIDFDVASIDLVINTHRVYRAGRPLHRQADLDVQRQELDDARSENDYTIREWVDAPGVQYLPVDGALELLPVLGSSRRRATRQARRWSSAPGFGRHRGAWLELDEPRTEGQRLVRALDPRRSGSRTSTSRGARRWTSTPILRCRVQMPSREADQFTERPAVRSRSPRRPTSGSGYSSEYGVDDLPADGCPVGGDARRRRAGQRDRHGRPPPDQTLRTPCCEPICPPWPLGYSGCCGATGSRGPGASCSMVPVVIAVRAARTGTCTWRRRWRSARPW